MTTISDLEEALERCANEEKSGGRVIAAIVDFLAEDEFWTIQQISPASRKKLIVIADKMRAAPETRP